MGSSSPFAQVMERWNQLPRARQLALAGIVAGTIVVAYFVFIASASPNLVVAFTGLAPEDSAAIADQLVKDGISYEIGGGGSTVSVPANKVAETRIKLAQMGLPKGGSVGLEIFDKTNFGAAVRQRGPEVHGWRQHRGRPHAVQRRYDDAHAPSV